MKTKLLLPALLTLLLSTNNVQASDAIYNGINYTIDSTALEASIAPGSYSGDVVIPETFLWNGKTVTVTGLDKGAFQNCTNLKSIVLPNTIIRMKNTDAFDGCTNLTTVKLPDSLVNINSMSFRNCANLKDLVIPNSVTILGHYAFQGCNSIFGDTLFIPSQYRVLGIGVWKDCKNIKKIIFEDCEEKLRAHDDYWGIPFDGLAPEYVYLGRTVVSFQHFRSLRTVEVGPNLKEWGDYAWFVTETLDTLISNIQDPTQLSGVFNSNVYKNTKLIIPKGTLEKYRNTEGWKDFFYIEEKGGKVSGINAVISNEGNKIIGEYNISGQKVSQDTKGLVIVKYSDGTSKKIFR